MGLLATVTITAGSWGATSELFSFTCAGYDPAEPAGSLDSDPQNTQLTLFRNCDDSVPSWQLSIEATTPPAGWNAVKSAGMTFLKSNATDVGGLYTWGITEGQSSLLVQDTETAVLEYWDGVSQSSGEIIGKNIINTDIITNNTIPR